VQHHHNGQPDQMLAGGTLPAGVIFHIAFLVKN
jgi:hypothetical protein